MRKSRKVRSWAKHERLMAGNEDYRFALQYLQHRPEMEAFDKLPPSLKPLAQIDGVSAADLLDTYHRALIITGDVRTSLEKVKQESAELVRLQRQKDLREMDLSRLMEKRHAS